RNSSIGNSTAIRFHISSGTRQTVGTRRRLLLRPAAIHTSTPSPCDVQRCRTPWRAGDPALNHLWDRLLVPGGRLELPPPCGHRILSPLAAATPSTAGA